MQLFSGATQGIPAAWDVTTTQLVYDDSNPPSWTA